MNDFAELHYRLSSRRFSEKRVERLAWFALALSAALLLLFAAAVSVFGLPGADDWCFGGDPMTPIERANHLYQTYSGRWLAMASLSGTARAINLTGNGYFLTAIGLSLPLWWLGFLFAAKQVIERWTSAAMWSLLMLAVFWTTIPRPMEVFYWLAGVVCYAPAFALVAASLLLARRNHFATSSLCALGAALFNEIASLTALPFLAVMAYRDRRCAAPFIAMLVGFALLALAPGNHARMTSLQRPSIPFVAWSIARPYLSPLALLADLRLWAFIALILSLPARKETVERGWFVWPICAVVGVFGAAVAVTWATSTTLEPRVLAFMFAVLLSTSFVSAFQWRGIIPSRVVRVGAILALAVSLPASANVAEIVKVLPESLTARDNLQPYWQAIRAQRGKDVVAPPLGEMAFFGVYGPARDAKDVTNVCMARYLGVHSIRLRTGS